MTWTPELVALDVDGTLVDESNIVAPSVRDAVRRRFFTLVDTAGLDEDRARAGVVLRLVVLGLQQLEEPGLDSADRADLVTVAVTVAKAVQGDD